MSRLPIREALVFLLRGRHRGPSSYRLTRWLFLRLLGLVFLIAFLSFWVQVDGLIGSHGILPVNDYFNWVEERFGDAPWLRLPTLVWLDRSDGFLHVLCTTGVLLSLLLIADVAPIAALPLLWAVYLSLVNAGQTFLAYQWDVLLLESAALAVFLAPARLLPRPPWRQSEAFRGGLWLLRLLLFKLMFLSGAVKLLIMDETWWRLTALDYHYFTQPIPAWTSWYAHRLPGWFQKLSVFVMFLIELGAPFLIFGPRGPRLLGCGALVLLQVLIAATGNYTFFNLLTIVLCVPLLDDAFLRGLLPRRLRARLPDPPPAPRATRPEPEPRTRDRPRRWLPAGGRAFRMLVLAALVFVSALTFLDEIASTRPREGIAGPVGRLQAWIDARVLEWARPAVLHRTGPFHTLNGYGLFRAMTTSRPEIVVEGSRDGRDWREYEFRWKPGDPRRRPRLVAPHQPRLDWQMWFAALNPRRANWLQGLVLRLLEGEPAVLGLLGENPFPDEPPRYVRLVYYDYEFTTPAEKREGGAWWKRTRRGSLTPPLSLDNLRPVRSSR